MTKVEIVISQFGKGNQDEQMCIITPETAVVTS